MNDKELGIGVRFIKEYDITHATRVDRFDAFLATPRLPWWTRLRAWLQYYRPQQLMRRYLEHKGWVVFWLEEEYRHCGTRQCDGGLVAPADTCWLRLYEEGRKADREQ